MKKWYIVTGARSKGYVTALRLDSYLPSFTKETHYADSFKTKPEAQNKIKSYLKEAQEILQRDYIKLNLYTKIYNIWDKTSIETKIKFLNKYRPYNIQYQNGTHTNFSGKKVPRYVWIYFRWGSTSSEYSKTEHLHIKKSKPQLLNSINRLKELIIIDEKRIEHIINKFTVIQEAPNFRYNKTHLNFKWENRKETDNYTFCVCCGYAVPSVPEYVGSWENRFCVFCLARIGKEAEKKLKTVPDNIKKHYNSTVFLNNI